MKSKKYPDGYLLLVWLFAITFSFILCAGQKDTENLKQKSEFHYKLARNYYTDRNIPMALRELHNALELNPQNAEAHHLKGFIYLGLKDYENAIIEFKNALEIKPDYYEAMNNLGSVYIADGRYFDAVRILTDLCSQQLYGTPHLAYGNLGYAYYKLKDYKNAIKYLELSVFRNPRFCLGYKHIGTVYMELGKIAPAIENFEKSLSICPNFVEPYFYLGVLYQREKKFELAQQMFNKCFKLAPDSFYGKRCKSKQ